MFQLFPDAQDDLLDVESLPPTHNTELNYRTRPLTDWQEARITLLVLLLSVPTIVALAAPTYAMTTVSPGFRRFVYASQFMLMGWFAFRLVTGAFVRWEIILGLLVGLAYCGESILRWAVSFQDRAWYAGLALCWILCSLIARQATAWILVGPTVDHVAMKAWKKNLPRLYPHRLSIRCPELLTYYVSPLLLGIAIYYSTRLAGRSMFPGWAWPFVFVLSLHVVWLVWHALAFLFVPWPRLLQTWKWTWRAVVLFLTYDLYATPAAGVFRFPTRWLRLPIFRWVVVMFCMTLFAFAHSVQCPNPGDTLRSHGMFLGPLLLNFVCVTATAPLVFVSILWCTAGTLLCRFDAALSKPTRKDVSEWDNYIDRIVNSNDELEREHLFVGVTEKGDYPILVHQDIHDQHAHIVGDSGASKTALGIAPQVTQKIAKADSTVVIVDLKGDKALFETCRREAERTGKLKFRWISNEVGQSTFGFNPFLQSHNAKLSVEQLSQQLLQGLSLDYGIQYGAGYFTAMNEIVLNNVLREAGARSFAELGEHLSDRRWYATIGHEDDWKQARHLSALVKRLGSSQSINLTPDMHPDRPAVHAQAIDMANLYEEPQVIYLWLRSAVEPTNAPAIARLFLWAMFTAASHQPQDKNRVYFFIDEMQQIISDGMKLIFEQFRDLGGTIIAAHQTAGQLRRQGTDLADTIDSCTAMKQVFRASDIHSLERWEKFSGTRMENVPTWYQPFERGTGEIVERYDPLLADKGLVRISPEEKARLGINDLMAVSSRRHSSLVRFTFGSGYTQFAGATVPMKSQYHISFDEYQRRRQAPWPTSPGAFKIEPPKKTKRANSEKEASVVSKPKQKRRFTDQFRQRATRR